MGYYSLYRIIKDIVRTIFGSKFWRKFLIVIIIALGVWFFLHSKGYAVEQTEDINFKVKSYYNGVVNDFIIRFDTALNNNNSLALNLKAYLLENTHNDIYYFYYGASDGSDYLGSTPINSSNINLFCIGVNANKSDTPLVYDYMGVNGYTMHYLDFTSNGRNYVFTTNNVSRNYIDIINLPIFVLTYVPDNWTYYVNALRDNDNATIISLLEDIKAEQQTTNDFLTDSSIDHNVINDLNSGYTAQSENITNNDITFQTGEQKETAWLSQLQSSFTGLSYRLPSNIDLTLPFVNKNLRISSNVFSRFIVGTQIETIIVAFWWVFFGMRIYRLVKRIVIHFASGQIFSAEANQSGPWKMHELLQYEIDRVGLDTFI